MSRTEPWRSTPGSAPLKDDRKEERSKDNCEACLKRGEESQERVAFLKYGAVCSRRAGPGVTEFSRQ